MRDVHARQTQIARARAELGTLPGQLAALERMTMRELREEWSRVFGYATATHNHAYLRKKIAWRLQELAEGGLSARARERIAELAPLAPIRHRAPRASADVVAALPSARDPRLPPAGSVLRRLYKGTAYEVVVQDAGFVYRGRPYSSLSAIAKEITGTGWNGLVFFGLAERTARRGAG